MSINCFLKLFRFLSHKVPEYGVAVAHDIPTYFKELKEGKYKFLTMGYNLIPLISETQLTKFIIYLCRASRDTKRIVVTCVGDANQTWETFESILNPYLCRICVFLHELKTSESVRLVPVLPVWYVLMNSFRFPS